MIYPKKIVPGLNRKTFFDCASENCQKECALNYDTANEMETLKCIHVLGHSTEIHSYSSISSESDSL